MECEKVLTVAEVSELILKAGERGRSFAGFIMVAVLNPERNGINPCFKTEEDLYDAYCAFMTGYIKKERGGDGRPN